MVPIFELFGKPLAIYPLMALIGIFSSGIFACRTAKRRGYDDNDMIVFLLISCIGIFLGMHLLYGLTNLPSLLHLLQNPSLIDSWQSFWNYLFLIFGGSVFYGGLLGGIAAGVLYGKTKGIDLSAWSDMVAPSVPLFHCFGRIGCFLGGCCFGVECRIGFVYHYSPIPEANGVTRFPIQLIEAAGNLILFFILSYLLKKDRLKGKLFCLYLLCYAPMRFLLEFGRGDTLRGIWLGLSTSQWISIFIVIGTLLFMSRKGMLRYTKPSRLADTDPRPLNTPAESSSGESKANERI